MPSRNIECHQTKGLSAFLRDKGGNENSQIFAIHHSSKDGVFREEQLTNYEKCVHTFGGFKKNEAVFCFSSNRNEDGTRFDVFVQELGKEEPQLVCEGPGGYFLPVQWSPCQKLILISRIESNFNQDLFVVDVETKELRCITKDLKQGKEAIFRSACWSDTSDEVYCCSTANKKNDLMGVCKIDLKTNTMEYVEESEHEIEYVDFKNGLLIWKENKDGASVLHYKNDRKKGVVPLPVGVVGSIAFANHNSSLIAFDFESPVSNPGLFVYVIFCFCSSCFRYICCQFGKSRKFTTTYSFMSSGIGFLNLCLSQISCV